MSIYHRHYNFEVGDRVLLPSGASALVVGHGRGNEVQLVCSDGTEVAMRDLHLRLPCSDSPLRTRAVPTEPAAPPDQPTTRARVPSPAGPPRVPSSLSPERLCGEPLTLTELELIELMREQAAGPIEGSGYRPTGSHPWRRAGREKESHPAESPVDKPKKNRGKPRGGVGAEKGAAR